MKTKYEIYGLKTNSLHKQLTKNEKEVLNDFEIKLLTTASPSKVKQGMRFILQFRDVVEKPITKITRKDLEQFWGIVNLSDHEYNTKVMIRRMVKRFCKWYYKDLELLEDLKIGEFKPNRKKINKTVLLNPEEIGRMLRAAERLRDKAMVILMYESGARPQEIKDLKWKDINWDTKEVHLDSSKTERDRDIPIEESLLHLKRWRQEYCFENVTDKDYVFPSRWRDRRMTTEGINRRNQTIANHAGIKKHITSYTLRHSRLNGVHQLGVKGLEHNKFSGHKFGSKQTATYVQMDNGDMKEEVLKKVYHIEEVTEAQAIQYKKEVGELKKFMGILTRKVMKDISTEEGVLDFIKQFPDATERKNLLRELEKHKKSNVSSS